MSDIGWTQERVDLLSRLWLDGLSASEVATQLGGVSRNAVIGKVHRLGLAGRKTEHRHRSARPSLPTRRRGRSTLRAPAQPRVLAPAAPIVEAIEGPGLAASVMHLHGPVCRWPIGDPKSDGFSFCGRHTADTGPYCPSHKLAAHKPRQPTPLRDDPVLRRLLTAQAA